MDAIYGGDKQTRLHSDDSKHFEESYSLKDKSVAIVCLTAALPVVAAGGLVAIVAGSMHTIIEKSQDVYHILTHTPTKEKPLIPYK